MIGAHSSDRDDAERIVEAFARAVERGRALRICGSGSKARRYPVLAADLTSGAGMPTTDLVSMAEHRGVCHYAPDELVLEARAGTPLADIERLLAQHQQMLAFEPPRFSGAGTLGGAVAAGLSGPARPWRGSLRDAVLGVELVNGLGERLQFGGRVVKNVAGYDLSRLQAGAFGTFGALLRICVRVLPEPLATQRLVLECDVEQALALMAQWSTEPLPLTGGAYADGRLHVRLQGAPDAIRSAQQNLGGDTDDDPAFWSALRDQHLPCFVEQNASLWRALVPAGTAALPGDAEALLDWGGAVRWYRDPNPETIAAVTAAGGWLCAYSEPGFAQGAVGTADIAQRLREAFDPQRLCNAHLTTALQPTHAH